MEAYVITSKGAEDICAQEIKEITNSSKIHKEERVVKFAIKNYLDLCKVCYIGQSIYRAVLLLEEFKVEKNLEKSYKNAEKVLKKIDFSPWLKKGMSFLVECEREGEHDFHSVDIAAEISKFILSKEKSMNTDFNNPDLIFYIYINGNKGYFGVDFSGMELAKRQYKIFNHPESLKGVTGYVLAREAGISKEKVVLDPFMGSGVIVIEAGLYVAKYPVRFYDKDKLIFTRYDFFKEHKETFFDEIDKEIKKEETKIYGYDSHLRFLKATQKNAKLAGINKLLNLSKVDVEWLDTKFDKNIIDVIVSDPPRNSNRKDDKEMLKLYTEFFYQAEFVIKKKGKVVLLTKSNELIEKASKKYKFKINKKYKIYQGQEIFNIVVFKRD